MRLPILRSSLCVATLALGTMLSSAAHAAPCTGFIDVDDSSQFCKNVEWLKNRAITLGCSVSQYCPNDFVTRIAMAAFLRRLGDALTPVHRNIETTGNQIDIDVSPVICSTPDFTVTGAPRKAHGHAVLVAGFGTGPVDFAARYVESTNGGASWTPVSPENATTSTTNERQTINVLLPPRDLVVGSTYRYALGVSRVAGSATTADPGAYLCSVRVTIENRNPALPPLDEDD